MRLSGEASINAAVADVYAALHDPAILVRTIPGCQRLERVGADSYKATVLAGVASIKGSFDGDVSLADTDAPHSFTLHAAGAGAPGTVRAVAHVQLAPEADGGTLLRYDAEATIGGVLAGVGQRVITGVARRTATDFFTAIDRELSGVPPVAVAAAPAAPAPVIPEPAAVAGLPAPTPVGPGGPVPAVGAVWTAPARAGDLARQRMRDLLLGAAFGALVALLGVLVGAIVAGW